MPVHYTLEPARHRLHTICSGPVTLEEVLAHFAELAADPQFRPGLDVLLDLVPCTTIPTPAELQAVTATIEALGPQRPFGACAVVSDRPALFGMSRVFEAYVHHAFTAFRVFRAEDAAQDWLAAQRPAEIPAAPPAGPASASHLTT